MHSFGRDIFADLRGRFMQLFRRDAMLHHYTKVGSYLYLVLYYTTVILILVVFVDTGYRADRLHYLMRGLRLIRWELSVSHVAIAMCIFHWWWSLGAI